MSRVVDARREGAIAILTLRRPDEANALDLEVARELAATVSHATADPSCAVIVLASEGDIFCAGGDVAAMSNAESPSGYVRDLAGTMHRTLVQIAESDLILVSAVQGAAAGAGLALVLNSDLAIASEEATFLSAYSAVGLSPDCGLSYLLPRTVGRLRANQMVLGGRRIDAPTAMQWGLVNSVVPRSGLLDTVMETAARVARIPALSRSASKRLLRAEALTGYASHLDDERDSIAALSDSVESIELRKRFLDRSGS
jgi:2-(1,2-epoxy-1,2-dihydrophenyl)acetyl-CoA isomerase